MAMARTTQSLVLFPSGFGLHLIHKGVASFACIFANKKPAGDEASGQLSCNLPDLFE
jgi:hypothetical protein